MFMGLRGLLGFDDELGVGKVERLELLGEMLDGMGVDLELGMGLLVDF